MESQIGSNPLFRGWIFYAKDATGSHFIQHSCWQESDGNWVMPHPTDSRRGVIPVPKGVKIKASFWRDLQEKKDWFESNEI